MQGMVELGGAFGLAHRLIDGQALDARHRGDRARGLAPSMTNSGQIRSSVVSTFSRTMRRAHSVRRLRRGRVVEIERRRGRRLASTGTTRTRASIGRPYLMAIDALHCRLFLAVLTGPVLQRH